MPAYALLEGPNVLHYVRTVSVTLGRSKDEDAAGSKRKAPSTKAAAADDSVEVEPEAFVGLGKVASVSKKHFQIVFDFSTREWMLICFGRNGFNLNGVAHPFGTPPVQLTNRARIQAPGGHHFFFLTPYINDKQTLGYRIRYASKQNDPQLPLAIYLAMVLSSLNNRPMSIQELTQSCSHCHRALRADANLLSSIGVCMMYNGCFVKHGDGHFKLKDDVYTEICTTGNDVLSSKVLQDKVLGMQVSERMCVCV